MARFEGVPVVTFLDDGRRVQLSEDFSFVDAADTRWDVPKGAIVDGASIPRFLWSFIGGPFEGIYRNASVIHDWYCDLRSRPWTAVHRMFYEGMIISGVGRSLAKLMYAGVYMGGPRWSQTVVSNVSLLAEEYLKDSGNPFSRRLHYPMPMDEFGIPERRGPYADTSYSTKTRVYRYEVGIPELEKLKAFVHSDTELKDIEDYVDSETPILSEIIIKETTRRQNQRCRTIP